MSDDDPWPPSPTHGTGASPPLTAGQAQRRERVIQAALRLAADGGYDAVQMRDVATEADVALGTIYRYFSSKDHLLAAAMAEWTGALTARLLDLPVEGASAVDRLVVLLRHACRSLEHEPRLTGALITSISASGPDVAQCQREVERQLSQITASALTDLDTDVREDVEAVLRHVWYSALLTWANGRADIGQVGDELERAARLLLGGPHNGEEPARRAPRSSRARPGSRAAQR